MISTLLLLLCVKHRAHRDSKSRVYSGPPTRSYTAAAAGVAVRCCCCCGLGTRTHTRTVPLTSGWRVYIPRRGTHQQASQQAGPDIYRRLADSQTLRNTTSYILLQRGFTAIPARCWAALYGVGCLSVRAAKAVSLQVCVRACHLSACLFHVSACGAIIAVATANSRRLSQQNPSKTCVSLVELCRTSRRFIVHFEKISTKKFPRYRRCARYMPW